MLHRDSLWLRVSGARLWPLAWALGAACLVPWAVPETWPGELSPWTRGALGLALGAALPLVVRRDWRWVPVALALGAWTLLGLATLARRDQVMPSGLLGLEGEVAAPWLLRGEQRRSLLRLAGPAGLEGVEVPVSLPAEGLPPPPPGSPVRLRTELLPVDPAPAFLLERPLWRARDLGGGRRIRLRSALQFEILGPPRPSPLVRVRSWALSRFEALPLDGVARDLWGALTLGIPPAQEEVTSAFAESGTIHTLVVSGLQVTLVMMAVEALLRRFGRLGAAGSALAGLGYAALVGFSAPVWRGLLMGLGWCLGRGTGWRLPPVLTLHAALLAWLLLHPAAGCDPGFLLAWFALLGLVWGAEPLAGLLSPLLGRFALPVARLLGPWLSTLPLLALFHGGAPLWGVAANALVLPLVAVCTPLCLGLTLLPIPGLVQGIGWILERTATGLVPFFARTVPLCTGVLWPWLLLAGGWIALAQAQACLRRTRALALGLLLSSLGLVASRGTGRAPEELSLEVADAGQGDALLLRVPGGRATVVDAGASPWAARRLVRTLSRRGVREPVHLVLTHPHGDHAGGWSTLARLWPLEGPSMPDLARPGEAWAPFAPPAWGASRGRLRGETWSEGEALFSVRWPPSPLELPDPNMVSLVLTVSWRDWELWLMGDALAIQERDLLALGDPGGRTGRRLLKVGHHGSATASDPAWLDALRPDVALVSAPRRSEFPDARPVQALRALGTQVHLSGASGGVRFVAEAGGWQVERGR